MGVAESGIKWIAYLAIAIFGICILPLVLVGLAFPTVEVLTIAVFIFCILSFILAVKHPIFAFSTAVYGTLVIAFFIDKAWFLDFMNGLIIK